ncbi:MAG: helix-turn-helix domain-containing protein [Candidatus Hydrogenedentes bacterium]|nr:helix-turn-helix domain-containing protein [Candidatus Hydrogenedentota bacterium]
MDEDILSLEEAAHYLKVKAELLSPFLESGELAGRKIGGEWRTTRRAIASFVDGAPLSGSCCVPVEMQQESGCCQQSTGRCC